ncbi:Protein of unknown function [Paracoccus pantotrophus]|nr:DUF3016 domain-containing protein [Paracoccus pantotrophus]MDF3855331.1 DUF3016 domain-containing protein [Paracoccus pantotrophus]SFO66690.1 Protein of unknown function [Paracoccus pantotrophus]
MLRKIRPSLSLALAAPAALAGPAAPPAEGRVTVTYVAPETFRDREFRRARSRASALAEFDRWFAELGARCLPPGQSLAIEVLDIDWRASSNPGAPASTTCASCAPPPRRASTCATG